MSARATKKAAAKKAAAIANGAPMKLGELGERDRGRYLTTPDGRRWRCSWPTYGLGGLASGLVDGWFLTEHFTDGTRARDVTWHKGDVAVVVEPAALVAEDPGGDLDPVQVFR